MNTSGATNLDRFYAYGDVYETLDTCEELEMLLGRLKRQRLMSEAEWQRSKENVAHIRTRLENFLQNAG